MTRWNVHFVLMAVLSLGLLGCPKKDKEAAMYSDSGDLYSPPMSATSATPTYSEPAYPSDVGTSYTTSAGRSHTVAKGDTLYSLARKYYNDQRRWRDIYEANRDQISDPNKIRTGQRLTIP